MYKTFISNEDRQIIIDLHNKGFGCRKISKQVPQGWGIIQRVIQEENLSVYPNYGLQTKFLTKEEKQLILNEYNKGIGVHKIRAKLGFGVYTIQRIIKEANIPSMPKGAQNKYKSSHPDNIVCPTCGIEKPKKEFSKHCRNKNGLQNSCKECNSKLATIRNKLRWYGLTFENYKAMEDKQQGLCACCGQPETYKIKGKSIKLGVDHNHKTGKVRQLLCNRCNRVLGMIHENEDICDNLKQYIKRHKELGE